MRGLTLHMPYAALIAAGAKSIETRSWGTPYRGPILIHAAKRCDAAVEADCHRAIGLLKSAGFTPATDARRRAAGRSLGLSLGHVLAVARLADCRVMNVAPADPLEAAFGWYGLGRHGWVLEDVRPLDEPVPWKGTQGLWVAPPGLVARVEGQLAEAAMREGGKP